MSAFLCWLSPPLKSTSHSEVRYFLYSFVNELTVGVSSAPTSMYLPEAVMNATRPQVLEYVVEGKRETMKYLIVIGDGVVSLRHKGAY